jgi:hypothetical protein
MRPYSSENHQEYRYFFGMWEQRKDVAGKDVRSPFDLSEGR